MKSKAIRRRFDNLLTKDRSKRFIEHIIKAYVPPYEVQKIYEEPNDDFVCAITNEPLMGLNEAKQKFNDGRKFDELISTMFTDNGKWDHPFQKKISDKEVGITSNSTETYISYSTFLILYKWAIKEYFRGNKAVRRILRKDEDMLVTKAKDFREEDKSVHSELSKIEQEKRETTTLGDLQELKELKNKMSKND